MSPGEFKKLLDRYFHGECTPDEVAFVEKWYDQIQSAKELSAKEEAELQQRIWANARPAKKLTPTGLYWKVAAVISLIILAAVPYLLINQKNLHEPTVAQVTVQKVADELIEAFNHTKISQPLTLSDGSVVTLAPNSSIRYPEKFEKDQRIVELKGEAFFQVKRNPDKPFLVYSNEIVTKVLGTSFRITAYDESDNIVVAVRTGKVAVYEKSPQPAQSSTDVILLPNQRLVYHRNEDLLIKEVVPKPVSVAADSSSYFEMQFDGLPVTEIFDIIEKNYGIDIQYNAELLQACVLTTKMTEEGFYDRIDVICRAINATYSTEDGVVIIKSQGCQ